MSNDTVRATVYLQIEAERNRDYTNDVDNPRGILGAKVVNATQKRASKPKPGTVEVKLDVVLPKAVFLALRPEAVVEIPASLAVAHPIEVEAHDANQAEEQSA